MLVTSAVNGKDAWSDRIRKRRVRGVAIDVLAFEHVRGWLRSHATPRRGLALLPYALPVLASASSRKPTSWSISRDGVRRAFVRLSADEAAQLEAADYASHGVGNQRAFHARRRDCAYCASIGYALLAARLDPTEVRALGRRKIVDPLAQRARRKARK